MNRAPYIWVIAFVIVIAAIFLAQKSEPEADLAVAVASNFEAPAKMLASTFEKETGLMLTISTGSTGKHYAQIKNGAPFDVFLAADSKRPTLLEDEQIGIPGTRFAYAMGRLVLWSPDPNRFTEAFDFFKKNEYRYLALANPKLAPYGMAADEFLFSLGIAERDRCVYGENIAQTFHFVKSGAADAGLVALSQVLSLPEKERGSLGIIPTDKHSPISQEAILLSDTPTAREFMKFLQTNRAQEIIRSFGYDLP